MYPKGIINTEYKNLNLILYFMAFPIKLKKSSNKSQVSNEGSIKNMIILKQLSRAKELNII